MTHTAAEIIAMRSKVLAGIEQCNEIMSDLNRESLPYREESPELASITCYLCEKFDTVEENLKVLIPDTAPDTAL